MKIVIALVLTVDVLAAAQQAGVVEPRTTDRYARVRDIAESMSGKRPASDAELRELLLAGMRDSDVFVRSESVGMVASILMLSSMPTVPPNMEWALARRKVAESLWAELDAAADDAESRVRSEALRGIAASFAYGYSSPVLSSQIANRLAEKFERDPSPGIRGLAVSAFRMAHRNDDPAVRSIGFQILIKALEDSDPSVVQAAAHSVAESRPLEALPLLVKQLRNLSPAVRIAVGQIIAAYREDARAYLPQLEAALASETDDIARKTIAGTLSVIGK